MCRCVQSRPITENFTQRCLNIGPTSQTLAQYLTNAGLFLILVYASTQPGGKIMSETSRSGGCRCRPLINILGSPYLYKVVLTLSGMRLFADTRLVEQCYSTGGSLVLVPLKGISNMGFLGRLLKSRVGVRDTDMAVNYA